MSLKAVSIPEGLDDTYIDEIDWWSEEELMKVIGCKVIHTGSGVIGTLKAIDGSYSWVLMDDGSEVYVFSGELKFYQEAKVDV